jgi:hypothetical protein
MVKGAVGVGYKKNSDFALWPVMSVNRNKQDIEIIQFV